MPGSPLGTLVGAFADEAGIGFDELTGLTESVLTLDQHGAAALAVHGEDAAMLLTLCQQTIAFLTLTQAFTVHALTKATAEQRLTVEHGPGATPSASARGRAAGRARTAVVGEAVASCGFDPAQRALVSHLAGMDADRTQVAARLLAQGVLTGPMVAMLLSRRTEHLTDSQVAWLTRHCADLTHPTTNDHHNSDSRDSTDSTDRDSNVSDDGAGAGACETGVHRDDTAAAPAGSEGEGGRLRLVGSLSRRERVALARRQAFAEACDWTDADWVDPDTAVPSWAVFRDRFDQGLAWLLADDPDIAGDYETGMAARCVSSRLDPEGTGSLTVTGDGVAVAAARNRVHRLARRLRQLGDERTVAQIAADLTLTLLTHGYVTCPHCGHTITTTPTNNSSGSTASSTGQVADGGPAGGCGGVHDDRADGGGCDGSSGSQAAAGGRAGACAGVHDGADEGAEPPSRQAIRQPSLRQLGRGQRMRGQRGHPRQHRQGRAQQGRGLMVGWTCCCRTRTCPRTAPRPSTRGWARPSPTGSRHPP
ncbi:hypothetical protein [Arsenicicoccus piscis]|uniref:DUF222 domain-containing protein n=1 Tax=Arsenicicoccus piscis TaxID=673954 RepID=A0ABQ6HN96_9MICO|nr:hypothetical protein [Arsenicicoccus piscis]GMA19930.1 hypothetical protein GCM10025862_19510 [Arsenicicoccus piscis]